MSIENLLLSYADDLDDAYPGHEFSIWSKDTLLTYFNEALCLIAAQRPDMFTELKVVKVDPCNSSLDLCDCVKVLDVLGQSDKYGHNIRAIPRRKTKTTAWTGAKRSVGLSDEITGYELLDTSNIIRLHPSNLNPKKDLYVVVRCSIEPKTYSLNDEAPDERCAFLAAARHWVLYNAKMKDGEFSQSMQQAAKEHRDMFTTILGFVQKADDTYDKKAKT